MSDLTARQHALKVAVLSTLVTVQAAETARFPGVLGTCLPGFTDRTDGPALAGAQPGPGNTATILPGESTESECAS